MGTVTGAGMGTVTGKVTGAGKGMGTGIVTVMGTGKGKVKGMVKGKGKGMVKVKGTGTGKGKQGIAAWSMAHKTKTAILQSVESNTTTLKQRMWHDELCKTTHCVAGNTTILTNGGKQLERLAGTPLAAYTMYFINQSEFPNFYEMDNERALSDLRKRASKE